VDAVALTYPDTLMVSGGGVGLVKAVFDAARDGDRQRPTGGLRLRTGTCALGRKTKLPALLVLCSCPCVWLLFT